MSEAARDRGVRPTGPRGQQRGRVWALGLSTSGVIEGDEDRSLPTEGGFGGWGVLLPRLNYSLTKYLYSSTLCAGPGPGK